MRRDAVVLLMILPLASCGLFQSRETRALRRSPDYRAGYQDGCGSANGQDANKRQESARIRDESQYKNNKAYRMGWDRGLNACRSTGYAGGPLPGTVPSGPVPDMNPGNGGLPRGL